MIKPFQAHDRLLADIQAARQERDRAHLWWLGQSGFLLQWQDQHLLLDPYLSDSLTKKYATTDKPHVRMTERVIDPSQLGFVDVVTSSHHHTDHLDPETLAPLVQTNPEIQLLVPKAHRDLAATRAGVTGDHLTLIDAGESITLGDFTFHAVPAAHETIEKDEHGNCLYLGYVVEFGGKVVYHSGDTLRYDGMAERLARWKIDMALLPINGRLPERRVAGNLWGREAARLAYDCGAKMVVPCHYEMFEFNTATTEELVTTCEGLGQRYQILRAGERWSF